MNKDDILKVAGEPAGAVIDCDFRGNPIIVMDGGYNGSDALLEIALFLLIHT